MTVDHQCQFSVTGNIGAGTNCRGFARDRVSGGVNTVQLLDLNVTRGNCFINLAIDFGVCLIPLGEVFGEELALLVNHIVGPQLQSGARCCGEHRIDAHAVAELTQSLIHRNRLVVETLVHLQTLDGSVGVDGVLFDGRPVGQKLPATRLGGCRGLNCRRGRRGVRRRIRFVLRRIVLLDLTFMKLRLVEVLTVAGTDFLHAVVISCLITDREHLVCRSLDGGAVCDCTTEHVEIVGQSQKQSHPSHGQRDEDSNRLFHGENPSFAVGRGG